MYTLKISLRSIKENIKQGLLHDYLEQNKLEVVQMPVNEENG